LENAVAPPFKAVLALGAGFIVPALLAGLVLFGSVALLKGSGGARSAGAGWNPGKDAVRLINQVLGQPEPVAAEPQGSGLAAAPAPQPQYANLLPWSFRITSEFGHYPNGSPHFGLDLDATYGVIQTAPVGGVVEEVLRGCGEGDQSCGKGWGNHVWWKSNVTGHHILLAHFSRLEDWVQVGAEFEAGRPVGVTGSTGYSSGPHTHIQVNPERCCENAGSTNPAWEFPDLRCGEPVLGARFGAQCNP
jgi:murein DD-endopeptidase MepM/ murein hydrolase activator NlpD